MGFIEVRAYANKRGTSTVFMQSRAESKAKISELLDKLF